MIALALLGGIMTQIVPAAGAPAVRPIDWDRLPPLPYRHAPRVTPRMTGFVATEMQRTGCTGPAPVDGRIQVHVDVAVLIGNEGLVRATIPRAIACPVVEQYAAGLVISFTRNNMAPRLISDGGWYRATILFDWPA